MLRIHIGHHFFGSGNLGDDWTLAGFLVQTRSLGFPVKITCCSPHDHGAMRRRFPEVEWLPCTVEARRSAIAASDAWLGIGGTPFQSAVSLWLLDHISSELDICEEVGKPAYLLGAGVESPAAMSLPQTKKIVKMISHIWARDYPSAVLLREINGGRVSTGGDLAHLYFFGLKSGPGLGTGRPGLVINVEDPEQVDLGELLKFARQLGPSGCRWIAQEVRILKTSEMYLWSLLSPEERAWFTLRQPDYATADVNSFVDIYDGLSALLSTRYHSGMAAAWLGIPLALYARAEKVEYLRQELDVPVCSSLRSAGDLSDAMGKARLVDRGRMNALADRARSALSEFFTRVHPQS